MDIQDVMHILEAIMLLCFGCSWPVNLYKSIKYKSTKGKSLIFILLIDIGYVLGITAKIMGFASGIILWSEEWWVFLLYIFNLVMVSSDLILYFINYAREKKNGIR